MTDSIILTSADQDSGQKYKVLPHPSGWHEDITGRTVEIRTMSAKGDDACTWCGWWVPVNRLQAI